MNICNYKGSTDVTDIAKQLRAVSKSVCYLISQGGGGGSSSLFPLTGTGTATGDVEGALAGFNLGITGGNVGIGTTTPTAFFDISDGAGGSALNVANDIVWMFSPEGTPYYSYFNKSSFITAFQSKIFVAGDLEGFFNNTNITLDDNAQTISVKANNGTSFTGNVGIGTATPSVALDVVGAATFNKGTGLGDIRINAGIIDAEAGIYGNGDVPIATYDVSAQVYSYSNGAYNFNNLTSKHNFGGDVLPSTDSTYDLGSSSQRWKDLWLTGDITATGNIIFSTAGKGIQYQSGTGARAGNATLVAGTVTVTNTTVTANTIVMLTRKTAGGTLGNITYTVSAGASFTINSDNALDTSIISYVLYEVN